MVWSWVSFTATVILLMNGISYNSNILYALSLVGFLATIVLSSMESGFGFIGTTNRYLDTIKLEPKAPEYQTQYIHVIHHHVHNKPYKPFGELRLNKDIVDALTSKASIRSEI